MPHKRQQIREAIVAALEATPEFAGRTFSTRLRTTEVGEMPVTLVYMLRETSGHYDVSLTLGRTVQAAIEIKADAPGQADIADVLDGYCSVIEAAIYADPTLGGLALGLELVETRIGLDGSGNTRDGNAVIAFDVRYLTENPAA